MSASSAPAPLHGPKRSLGPHLEPKAGGRTMDVIIYHNPDCETSRNTLAMIRNACVEPHIVEYLKSPPTRLLLTQMLARAGLSVREILREKGTPFHELGL